jgi:hypothetical protein
MLKMQSAKSEQSRLAVAAACVGILVGILGHALLVHRPTPKVEVILGPEKKPLEVYSYYMSGEQKVLHGSRIMSDWPTNRASGETYVAGKLRDREMAMIITSR